MQSEMNLVIVVPIYKVSLTESEYVSLKQVLCVFKYNVQLSFVHPSKLDLGNYLKIVGNNRKVNFIPFPDKFFSSISSYNKLLVSLKFYRKFSEFKHMLIYHLDAFIFKNDIDRWIRAGFDSIGAPIYEYDGTPNPKNYIGTGNGGFSLRKIDSCIKVLQSNKVIFQWDDIISDYKRYNWKGKFVRAIYYFDVLLTIGSRTNPFFNRIRVNEDVFWNVLVPKYFNWFNVPDRLTAARFSVEFNAKLLLDEIRPEIPLGCHGWDRKLFKGVFDNLLAEYKCLPEN